MRKISLFAFFLVLIFSSRAYSVQPPRDGVHTMFYENGTIKSVESYRNGKKDGLEKNYYETGLLKSEWNYNRGIKNGWFKLYYADGRLKGEGMYRNGVPQGIFKRYHEDGRLWSIETYEAGVLVRKDDQDIQKSRPQASKEEVLLREEKPRNAISGAKKEEPEGNKIYYENDAFGGEGRYKTEEEENTAAYQEDNMTEEEKKNFYGRDDAFDIKVFK